MTERTTLKPLHKEPDLLERMLQLCGPRPRFCFGCGKSMATEVPRSRFAPQLCCQCACVVLGQPRCRKPKPRKGHFIALWVACC